MQPEAKLNLKDGSSFAGKSFGAKAPVAGEVVFATGMMGYPESLTDPSFAGQILVFTYPLLGNYGVPKKRTWESPRIQAAGIVVSDYIATPSHHASLMSLGDWLKAEGIPGVEIKDTRLLAKKLRVEGTMLGTITFSKSIPFEDPNRINLVAGVSRKKPVTEGSGKKTIVLFDCGAKANIARSFIARGARVITVPWNYDIFAAKIKFDAVAISNGPGDPKMAKETIAITKKILERQIPTLGICLGNQLLALAAGGDTYKLKFGHRGQNQPCRLEGSNKSYLTTQNHGFAVGKIPKGFRAWFTNANDGTNEGLRHGKLPFMSVQFHPEACPGPVDTDWIFDHFLEQI